MSDQAGCPNNTGSTCTIYACECHGRTLETQIAPNHAKDAIEQLDKEIKDEDYHRKHNREEPVNKEVFWRNRCIELLTEIKRNNQTT